MLQMILFLHFLPEGDGHVLLLKMTDGDEVSVVADDIRMILQDMGFVCRIGVHRIVQIIVRLVITDEKKTVFLASPGDILHRVIE